MDLSNVKPMPMPITSITVHCAATPEGRNNTAEEVTSWDIARFKQPSYHFVIELDGTIKNTLPTNKLGAHVADRNSHNLGVCYVGGMDASDKFPKDTRTPEQRASLVELLTSLKHIHPNAVILGHRDWPNVKKACPSFDVKPWIKEVGL